MIQSLFRKSGVYFIALLISKALTTFTFLVFARHFQPAIFGELVLYTTLLSLVTLGADFGLIQWYQKHADNEEGLFKKVIGVRLYTMLISSISAFVLLWISKVFSLYVIALFLINLIPEAILSVADGYYLHRRESFKVGLKNGIKMLILLIGFLIYKSDYTFFLVIVWHIFASVITMLWYFPPKRKDHFYVSLKETKKILTASSSYAILLFTSMIYSRGDALIIRAAVNTTALGIYGSAYRYLDSISMIPTALSHNLFPLSAKTGAVTSHQLSSITKIMTGLGILCSALVFLLADFLIITLLGPAYADGVITLRIFAGVILLFFINAPLSTVVQSSHLVKDFVPYGIFNTGLNITLNILLVPLYGIQAAAWVMFITELTGLLINVYFVKKIYRQ